MKHFTCDNPQYTAAEKQRDEQFKKIQKMKMDAYHALAQPVLDAQLSVKLERTFHEPLRLLRGTPVRRPSEIGSYLEDQPVIYWEDLFATVN